MAGKIGLLLLFTLVSLLGAECAARLELLPLPGFVEDDAWWEERWHRHRRGLNPRVFVELDPELGFIPAANLRDVEYEGVRISTNSSHMRGEREYPLERTGSARVVAIGDSFTFGQCARDEDTFPAAMEQVLPDAEVLNLGVMGYGQGQALLRLLRDGLPYEPDAVVFGFAGTDIPRNTVGFRGYGKPRFRLDDDGLHVENVPVPRPEEYESLWRVPRIWNFWRIFDASRRAETREHRVYLNDVSLAIVDRLKDETRERGIPLYVAHIPHPSRLSNEGEHGWPWLQRMCDEREEPGVFQCVSPVPRFREIATTEALVRKHFDCHLSPELYRALGEVMADALVEAQPEVFGTSPGAS